MFCSLLKSGLVFIGYIVLPEQFYCTGVELGGDGNSTRFISDSVATDLQ